jgi:hypothetical protein
MNKSIKINSKTILESLRNIHPESEWLFAGEVGLLGFQNQQRIDAFAVALWPSKKAIRHSYEIKVSRQDFLNEIKNPQKRQFALDNSEQFWFAIADGIADKSEIPDEAGLLIYKNDKLISVKNAPKRKVPPITTDMLLSIAKRMRTEAKRSYAANNDIPGCENIARLFSELSVIIPHKSVLQNETYLLLSKLRQKGHMKEALKLENTLKQIQTRIEKEEKNRIEELMKKQS